MFAYKAKTGLEPRLIPKPYRNCVTGFDWPPQEIHKTQERQDTYQDSSMSLSGGGKSWSEYSWLVGIFRLKMAKCSWLNLEP